jgi:hypothetical protein
MLGSAWRPSRPLLRQREEWIRFSYSNEDTKDEEKKKGLGRPKCGPKRQARTLSWVLRAADRYTYTGCGSTAYCHLSIWVAN